MPVADFPYALEIARHRRHCAQRCPDHGFGLLAIVVILQRRRIQHSAKVAAAI
jgi:hypothetical protein